MDPKNNNDTHTPPAEPQAVPTLEVPQAASPTPEAPTQPVSTPAEPASSPSFFNQSTETPASTDAKVSPDTVGAPVAPSAPAPKTPSSGRNKKRIIIAAAVALLAVIGGIIFSLFLSEKQI